jgi:hypothetical protein
MSAGSFISWLAIRRTRFDSLAEKKTEGIPPAARTRNGPSKPSGSTSSFQKNRTKILSAVLGHQGINVMIWFCKYFCWKYGQFDSRYINACSKIFITLLFKKNFNLKISWQHDEEVIVIKRFKDITELSKLYINQLTWLEDCLQWAFLWQSSLNS